LSLQKLRKDKDMTYQEKIIEEILAEREYQDHKWGGDAHDDSHSSIDWVAFITKHLGRAVEGNTFRQQMVKVAALAVAAAEWHDRGTSRPLLCKPEEPKSLEEEWLEKSNRG